MKNLELELIQAASVIVNDLCKVQPGETVSITRRWSTPSPGR